MHIPDAVLDPKVAATAGVLAASGLLVGLRKLQRQLGERTTVLMGTMSAFVFAAQMVNFPVGPLPISGHLLGGVLSSVMLGPWAGAVVIAAVLIVQCLLFGDGGLTALGANFVNMGLIGALVGYAIYAPIRRAIGGRPGVLIGGMVAAWFSVLLASGAFAIELSAAGRRGGADFFQVLSWMALVHAGIGLGEALITGLVLRFVLLTRPDLVYEPERPAVEPDVPDNPGLARAARWGQGALAGLAIALAVGVFLAPFASEHPDGLEYVGAKLGFLKDEAPALVHAPIPDYQLPVFGTGQVKLATAMAGMVGTLVVFGVGLGLARIFSRRGQGPELEGVPPDAA
jgi:cobalt/nickel transport system permease protein